MHLQKRQVTVKLIGALGRRFFREATLFVTTPRDAINLICANYPEFVGYVRQHEERGTVFRVINGNPLGCDEDDLQFACSNTLVIGELDQGSGGLGRILAGALLLGVAFAVPGGIALFGSSISSFAIGALGASLILGGITQMLSPQQKQTKQKDKLDSFLFSNTSAMGSQGRCVPWGFGVFLVENPILISQSVTVSRIPV